MIVCWVDDSEDVVSVQRLNESGSPQWALNGIPVSGDIDSFRFQIAENGYGGAVLAWKEENDDHEMVPVSQEVTSSGQILRTLTGRLESLHRSSFMPPEMVSQPDGQVILVFEDNRTGQLQLFASEIRAGGQSSDVSDWVLY